MRRARFRIIFEQEASPPERGVSKLDIVGGTYDKLCRFDPSVVEKEYAKLEPYINIYSCRPASRTELMPAELDFFEKFAKVMEMHPDKFKKFEEFIRNL